MSEVIRFKDLNKGDRFTFLGIPYVVTKVTATQVFYNSVNSQTGAVNPRANIMGRQCMMLVNKLPTK